MRKLYLFLLIVIVALAAISCSEKQVSDALTSAPFYASFADAKESAALTGKSIVIDFYTDW